MIQFKNITKSYKDVEVIKGITFDIEAGNLVSIIGESGSGKTTTLKMINRLVEPTSGTILIDGKDTSKMNKIAMRRNIGYVIQQTGLFPHMTVRDNIEIISKLENPNYKEIAAKTIELMDMVGLDRSYLDMYPAELSGGQQQRVGVARSFASDPNIILMDEPFSALDPITKSNLQDELVMLQSELHKTIVFVTHDMDEAIKLSDKICIMDQGMIIQYDTPEQILKAPATEFVANFVGKKRLWSQPELIKASDIMIENPIYCTKNLTIFKCIERMRASRVDNLMVVKHKTKELKGIIRAKSIVHLKDRSGIVADKMLTDFEFAHPDDSIVDILKLIDDKDISCVPVVDKEMNLLGVITKGSLVTTLSQQYIADELEFNQPSL